MPTNDMAAHGEIAWSWRPDAGAKPVSLPMERAGDGGYQARHTGESAYKP
jgi:hypothetical protein